MTRGTYASARFGLLVVAVLAIAAAGTMVLSGLLSPSLAAGDARDPDAVALATLGERTMQRARKGTPDATLRQVNVDPADPRSGWREFEFVNGAATSEIAIRVAYSTAPPSEWHVTIPELSKLTGYLRAGLELDALRVGPQAVARSITRHWPGCTVRALALSGQRADLTWYAFCDIPDGRVAAGTVDGRTGAFEPSAAPPAYPPPTALPPQQRAGG